MSKYFNPELVGKAFERLSSRNTTGKVHLERTSALMYFFAVDAACKYLGLSTLDLNPDSLDGKNCRKQVELQFSKLVLIENSANGIKQVIELGKIEEGGTSPDKRISSNFLTVPLKKASDQMEASYYPRRPNAPVLKMGLSATGKKWGVSVHDDWQSNLLHLLSTIVSPTPSLDLAIFVCRDNAHDADEVDLFSALNEQLKKKFTKNTANFWISKINKEKILSRCIEVTFSDQYFSLEALNTRKPVMIKRYEQMKKSDLIHLIRQLESKLNVSEQIL